jgi:ribose transport system substrate-binding protein
MTLLTLAALLLVTGFGFAEGAAEEEAEMEGPTFGIVISTLNNPFFVTLRDGAQETADELGVNLVALDSQNDSATEASNVEDLIARGVDALLINPTNAEAIVPSVQAANDAGIPVFTIDRSAAGGEVVANVASDNTEGGRMAGRYIVEQIGQSGRIVELQGIPGTSAARERGQGFNEIMDQHDGLEVIARQTANFDRAEGLNVFQNILQANSDIDATFAHNDAMVLGAIQAAESAGRAEEILFVGFDAIADAIQAIKDGRLAATVAQQPAQIGSLGVQTAYDYVVDGESVEDFIPVPLALVTEDNVGEFD